ncbi:MAG: class I SAM-dependent methyltransferase [Thermodesulfobacteriota bacterium]|nr:MAG: class I SAM-dependent methyltransferase [Thermodesulfobacteriota bacterium]
MEEYVYKDLYEMEDTYWWFRGQREVLSSLFGKLGISSGTGARKKILDMGCGTGRMLESLAEIGDAYGIDFSPTAIDFCRERNLRKIVRGTGEVLPFADRTFDIVTALGVLCHRGIRDDGATLKELARTIKSGGYLVLSEPAFMFVYGPHDEAQHCRKRYTAGEMKKLTEACGLRVEKLTYFNFFLFPVFVAHRLRKRWSGIESESDVQRISPLLNSLLCILLRLEAGIIGGLTSLPLGSSVVCIARKP